MKYLIYAVWLQTNFVKYDIIHENFRNYNYYAMFVMLFIIIIIIILLLLPSNVVTLIKQDHEEI